MPTITRRSPHPGADAPRTAGDSAASRVLDPKVYVLRDDWLEVLAGDDPALRRNGKPSATVISAMAGLDRTHLTQVKNGQLSLSLKIFGALVHFLEEYRGLTEEQARAALFERVTRSEAERRAAQAVPE